MLNKHGHGDELPKDARTLLQTTRKVVTTEKCKGKYYYFGLEKKNCTMHITKFFFWK